MTDELKNAEIPAEQFLGDDLEAAYLRALEANDAVEWAIGSSEGESPPANSLSNVVADELDRSVSDEPTRHSGTECAQSTSSSATDNPIRPDQVIEAALFVGGTALTTKKLRSLMQGGHDSDWVEQAINLLNVRYEREARPYEIRLAEGGYRLQLRPEYRKIQNRVFGLGPKEVRLSQDALEVLALVAYKQPVTKRAIEAEGKSNASAVLRQLLRRELIQIERNPESPKEVTYRTSPRFLSLFGLGSLDELPQAADFDLK